MFKHLIVSTSILAALALAGCANHAPPKSLEAKRAPIHAVAKQAAPTVHASTTAKIEAENEAGIDAIQAYGMNDALISTQDGDFGFVMIGSPVGTVITATAGRVVRETDVSKLGWTCPDYQKQNNGDVRACRVPRVVLVITPCIRSSCPRSNRAIVAVVPPKDAPVVGDVVTVLRGPVAGEVRVINDGFHVGPGDGAAE